jgi:hypothetical protein
MREEPTRADLDCALPVFSTPNYGTRFSRAKYRWFGVSRRLRQDPRQRRERERGRERWREVKRERERERERETRAGRIGGGRVSVQPHFTRRISLGTWRVQSAQRGKSLSHLRAEPIKALSLAVPSNSEAEVKLLASRRHALRLVLVPVGLLARCVAVLGLVAARAAHCMQTLQCALCVAQCCSWQSALQYQARKHGHTIMFFWMLPHWLHMRNSWPTLILSRWDFLAYWRA